MTIVTGAPEPQTSRAELPSKESTHSYWHRDPSRILLNHHTTPNLPASADVIVVGSGICGAFATRTLVAGGKNVVMFEAREACWGATGRNGGHCQPGVWSSEEEVARFELATFDLIKEMVEAHDIPCDLKVVGGVHAIYSKDMLQAAEKQIVRLQKYPDLKDKAVLITDKEELRKRHVPEALGAIYQPNAAKVWPYKLVAWVLETLLAENENESAKEGRGKFNLQTNTPVTSLSRKEDVWVAHTDRGEVSAPEILLASNAYTSYLLPGLTGLIVPVRGQVCALEPPEGAVQLPHSYVWTDASDQYLIHRGFDDSQVPGAERQDRSLVLGGERFAVPEGDEGISRDDAINPLISRALHRGLNGAVKLLPAGEPEKEALAANYEWTGIMGYSRDGNPWVGPVLGSFLDETDTGGKMSGDAAKGLWMSAGFTGHGMPVAPRCGIAVAEMILQKKDGDVKVPAGWIPSRERVGRASVMELPRTMEDMINSLPLVE